MGLDVNELRARLDETMPCSTPQQAAPPDKFEFGVALKCLRAGYHVYRHGWNGHGMYIGLQMIDAESANELPYLWIKSRSGRVPWVASQSDLLARDWAVR